MTSKKQKAANRVNSKKSTGAKTEQGKQVVSINAVKHGIFSTRLIMSFESADEYGQLLDGLVESLNPKGSMEQLLVEKIAVTMWRQLRLVRAESAEIEMNRSIYRSGLRRQIGNITSDSMIDTIYASDLKPETADQIDNAQWCKELLAELALLEEEKLGDLEHIKQFPKIMSELESEAKENQCETVQDYLKELSGGLSVWVNDLMSWCNRESNRSDQKPKLFEALALAQSKESSPIDNQLLMRYQTALDNELYRSLEALRRQQEWRFKGHDLLEVVTG
jgi:hypothetical protein